jgi:hypothetical protein
MAAIASRWLRRKSGRAARPAGDGSFRDIESEHLQLTVSVRSAPGGILGDHPEDERSELLAGRLAIETSTSGLVTFPHSP